MRNREITKYPVIGIRPTIDGRVGPQGVRGSLEAQTMAMAMSAKKLFEEYLGMRVESVDEVEFLRAYVALLKIYLPAFRACAAYGPLYK